MSPRIASSIAAASLALTLAACAGAGPLPSASPASATQTPLTSLAPAANPSTATTGPASASATATAAATASANASADSGNVVAPVGPVLSVEPVGALAIRVTLSDPAAKAWRLVVAGTGASAGDRWALTVETGDVFPVIMTRDTIGGVDEAAREQPGLEAGDGHGRVCALSVPVCVRSASVVLPADGNGTLVLEMARTDTTTPLRLSGATAIWPGDPFVLGPWTTTEAFPWEG